MEARSDFTRRTLYQALHTLAQRIDLPTRAADFTSLRMTTSFRWQTGPITAITLATAGRLHHDSAEKLDNNGYEWSSAADRNSEARPHLGYSLPFAGPSWLRNSVREYLWSSCSLADQEG